MTEKQPMPLRHRWRDLVKSKAGPPDTVLRCVLLVLGDWSPLDGGLFSVPTSVICEQTGLSDKPARNRLKQADGIWFTRQKRGRRYLYRLRIPTAIDSCRPLAQVRGRANGDWSDETGQAAVQPPVDSSTVDKSPDTGPTAPVSQNTIPVPPDPDTGPTAPVNTGPTAPARRKRHKKDVAHARARPVASLARAAPDSAGPEPPKEPPPGDEQLPFARIMLAVQQGDQKAFDKACESLRDSERAAAGHA